MQATLLKPVARQKKAHHYVIKLMGCRFVFTAIHEDPQVAWDGIRAGVAETERIENLISSWKDDSSTSRINAMAGVAPVEVEQELFDLIKRSQQLSKITKGAFDISGTLSRYYWKFDGKESIMPSPEKLEELRRLGNYHHIILDEERRTVFLKEKGMKIGFGAIGKGYAAVRAKMVMQNIGVESGLVNAAGDLLCWGQPLADKPWSVKISDPEAPERALAEFSIPHGSVVTSGGYEKFALVNGKKYSHIIDPRTGWPVEGLKSVSIICPNPELGDALATAVTVLGQEEGLALISQLKGVECLLVNNNNELIYSKK
ncbi:MAG: FAD:protein FMN transferase [Saprospiraceae bacterium]